MLNKAFKNQIKWFKDKSKVLQALYKYENRNMFDIKFYKDGNWFSYKKRTFMGVVPARQQIRANKLLKKVSWLSDKAVENAREILFFNCLSDWYTFHLNTCVDRIYKEDSVHSCMINPRGRRAVKNFYKTNKLKAFYLKDSDKKIVARTLVWQDINWDLYHDKIYNTTDKSRILAKMYLQSKWINSVWWLKSKKVFPAKLDEKKETPYFDSVKYFDSTLTSMSNKWDDVHFYIHNNTQDNLSDTMGTARCPKCDRERDLSKVTIVDWKILGCHWCYKRDTNLRNILIGKKIDV